MRTLTLISMFAVLSTSVAVAQEKAPKTERITYRVIGLFDKYREKDLRDSFAQVADIKLVAVNFDDAEVTLEFAPSKLFPGQKPERVTELVSDKLKSASHHTFSLRAKRTTPRDKLTPITIAIAGCDCKGCNLAAYEAVASIDGVEQATVSLKDKKLTALIDPSKTDKVKLEESLTKKGVEVGKKK
jgi:copper chaperone CopZ